MAKMFQNLIAQYTIINCPNEKIFESIKKNLPKKIHLILIKMNEN